MIPDNTDKDSEFDVLIIGGGPAGCSASLTLLNQTSFKIGIVESTDYSSIRIGESVSASIEPLLKYLKLDLSFLSENHIRSTRIDASWGTDNLFSREFFFTAQGHGWNLDRKKFDKMLMDKVKEKCDSVFLSSKIKKMHHDKTWDLTLVNNSQKEIKISSKIILDATGKKASVLRNTPSEWKVYDGLVGVGGVFSNISNYNQSVTLLEARSNGWWYSTPTPNDALVVIFMTDNDIANKINLKNPEQWHKLLNETRYVSRLVKNKKLDKIHFFPAFSQLITKLPNQKIIPVGDAAASFDPLSSIGIGHAVSSGIQGAHIANGLLYSDPVLFENYLQDLKRNFSNYMLRKKQNYVIEKRFQEKLFWKRRQK